ncbi:MAG TPA: efflux RND transporter periplasmic adaptor subunit, partial [Stellaceae bacterium]|nr:efflux RND transporter periplasmic adaptor subunit [Stellaceae bacterium]
MKLSSARAFLLCIGLAAVASCGKKPSPPPPPPPVGVVTAEAQSVPLDKALVGRLSSYLSANVTARVSGVLVKRVYTEGQEVKQGQLLFEIDPAFYQAQLKLALGTLASDQATLVDNRITAERDHKLLPTGFVSQQNVDDADAAERNSAGKVAADQAAVESARVNLGYTRVTSPIDGIASQQQVTVGAVVGSATS